MTYYDITQGQVVWQYKGNGTLQHDPSLAPVPCVFEVYQRSDGDIRLRCEANVFDSHVHVARGPEVILLLEGITTGGQPIRIDGPVIFAHTMSFDSSEPPKPLIIDYIVHDTNSVQVGIPQWESTGHIHFALTNFKFLGTEVETLESGFKLNSLKLNIAGKEIVIRKVLDYELRLDRLENIGGINITCEAHTTILSTEDRFSVENTINNLCRLLSIASGTLVSWLYFEVNSADNVLVYRMHRSAITRDYVSQFLIDPQGMNELAHFVETTYDKYVQLLATYRMIQVVHSFIEARGVNFLEARGLIILSLVDYLTGVLADSTGNDNLVPSSLYATGCTEFEDLVNQAAMKAYPNIDRACHGL